VLAQLIQVDFLTQGGAKSSHRLGGVVFAAVEAPINALLETMA
jgi:hypothetical protein